MLSFRKCNVAIVGGGAAGLGAALVLGRMALSVELIDSGSTRNRHADHINGFLTRDGVSPREFYASAQSDLAKYANVSVTSETVIEVRAQYDGIMVRLGSGVTLLAERLLIATGVEDDWPDIDGITAALWGKVIFSCPHCDGWEFRNGTVAILSSGKIENTVFSAIQLRQLGATVTLICDVEIPDEQRRAMAAFGIHGICNAIAKVNLTSNDALETTFLDGATGIFDALFISSSKRPRSQLAAAVGCDIAEDGRVKVNRYFHTTAPSVYAAGDVAQTGIGISIPQVISAAAEGAQAGIVINHDLLLDRIKNVQSKL
jgi:thioredoxin reductase